jgi:phage terminase large subunit-like protein
VPDYPAIARGYAEAVVSGRVLACKLIRLACERYLRMLKLAEDPANPFYFSEEHVVDYCRFLERLEHIESGIWERTQRDQDGTLKRNNILDPSQIWIEAAIQGFRNRLTHERVVTRALEEIPRKNAKSFRLAAAALYDLCCSGQIGPQITIAANSGKQADDTIFGVLLKIVGHEEDLVSQYKIETTKDEIRCGDGRIFKLTSQGERQDGLNPSLAIFEEGHAGAAGVYKVVNSAFGARPNALLRMITTAGYRAEGPGWELLQDAKRILLGQQEDYSFFAAIYTLDEEDYQNPETKAIDWTRLFTRDELLVKANPMYGVSLDPIKIAGARDEARRRPDLRAEFARTRFNIWTNSGASLIQTDAWAACRRKLRLEDMIGMKCWMGLDLASSLDMCSIGLLFELPNDILAVFAKYFLPEGSPTATDPDLADLLTAWAEPDQGGWLTLTPGVMADHDLIRGEVDAYCDVFDIQVIACDPYQAHNTVKHLWDGNRPVVVYPNSEKTMTAPTDDLTGRVVAQKVWHDGNPVLAWNAGNVHGDRRPNGKILPRKDVPNSKRKIDGFVALCFADGCRLQPGEAKDPNRDEPKQSAYESNRVVGLDAAE